MGKRLTTLLSHLFTFAQLLVRSFSTFPTLLCPYGQNLIFIMLQFANLLINKILSIHFLTCLPGWVSRFFYLFITD